MTRGLTDLLKSMTAVLPAIGFGRPVAPTIPREQEHTDEVPAEARQALHEQVHEPAPPRLERGHPKR
ncbi:MAG: hypothetical protein AB7L91_06695 [Dehalococcoidia bacterium]